MKARQAHPAPSRRRLPIVARHAISLAVVFAVALPVSYFVGQRIYRNIQLDKLESVDRESFEEGLRYVYRQTPENRDVVRRVTELSLELPPDRASELLITAAASVSKTDEEDEAAAWVRGDLADAGTELFARLEPLQAIGFYDAMNKTAGMPHDALAAAMLEHLDIPEDALFLHVVDLLETRLLWSKAGVPRAMWLRWLGLLAHSPAELSQLKSAQLLGELPDDAERVEIKQALTLLAGSPYTKVRAEVLAAAAGYAAIAEDPTDYEQIIFTLGHDKDHALARRAWLVVGYLNPLSGYAVNWKEAEPFVAEAMLWASVKTNPENPQAVWDAFDDERSRHVSLSALALLSDGGALRRLDAALPNREPEQLDIAPDRVQHLLSTSNNISDTTMDIACSVLCSRVDDADLRPWADQLLRSTRPHATRLAVLIAATKGYRPQLITGITAEFLRKHPEISDDELRAMPSAELAGLGLSRVDALTALLEAADAAPPSAGRQGEAKLLRLALWTRGDLGDDFTPAAEAMLFDEDLPTSTVLMCLLHKQRPVALAYLFGDLASERPDLQELFIQQRWWHVFRRFVDTSDLTLWLWGDPEAQAFQLEAMRQWYAVYRWKIERGWWPQPAEPDTR